MKKTILAIFVLITIGGAFFAYSQKNKVSLTAAFAKVQYQLEGKSMRLLVADTEQKWTHGLMNVRSLDGIDGMIFVFPQKAPRTFWNHNTFMDLTVYWVDGDRIVGKDMLPSIEKSGKVVTVSSPEPVDTVVEVVSR